MRGGRRGGHAAFINVYYSQVYFFMNIFLQCVPQSVFFRKLIYVGRKQWEGEGGHIVLCYLPALFMQYINATTKANKVNKLDFKATSKTILLFAYYLCDA